MVLSIPRSIRLNTPVGNHTLFVAATPLEANALAAQLEAIQMAHWPLFVGSIAGKPVELLLTGIGMINTAMALGVYLAQCVQMPAQMVQFGITGSYDPRLSLLDVVEITTEVYGDLGASSPHGFVDLEEMGFPSFTLSDGNSDHIHFNQIINPKPSGLSVPNVSGLSANTVAGDTALIALRKARWNPQVETMEGAAFFQSALLWNIPFVQLRCISNLVEPRDPQKWKIPEAATRMQEFIRDNLSLL